MMKDERSINERAEREEDMNSLEVIQPYNPITL